MRPVGVVIVNSFPGCELDLALIGETCNQIILILKRANHTFGESIVITIANFAHTRADTVSVQDFQVWASGVLQAMIAVIDNLSLRFRSIFLT